MRLVSIIIPTYNRAALLGDAIRGALAQTHPACEVIVVDDGSTDDSAAVTRSFGTRVRYLWQPNRGVARARNAGAAVAQGAYLYFLDSDDVPRPYAVERLVSRLDATPQAGIAYGCAEVRDDHGALTSEYLPAFTRPEGCWPGALELEHLLIRNYIYTGAALLSHALWQQVGGYDPACGGTFEDWELWARYARRAAVCFVPEVTLTVRGHSHLARLSARFGPENYLRLKRKIIRDTLADAAVAPQLAASRARIEAYYLYDEAWMAYATHDTASARAAMRAACARYPELVNETEVPGVRALWLKLKLPRVVMEVARGLKRPPV